LDDAFGQNICKAFGRGQMRVRHVDKVAMALASTARGFTKDYRR
jgi:hypothetical protein